MVWVLRGDQRRTRPICQPPATRPHRGRRPRPHTRRAVSIQRRGRANRQPSTISTFGWRRARWNLAGTSGSQIKALACSPRGTRMTPTARHGAFPRWCSTLPVRDRGRNGLPVAAACGVADASRLVGLFRRNRENHDRRAWRSSGWRPSPFARAIVARSAPAALCRSNVRSASFALAYLAGLQARFGDSRIWLAQSKIMHLSFCDFHVIVIYVVRVPSRGALN